MVTFVEMTPRSLRQAYRLGRWAILALAALYVVVEVGVASTYTGIGPSAVLFAARNLKADVYDVAPVMVVFVRGRGLGSSARPTRYALVCQEELETNDAEVAAWDKRLKFQIEHHTGSVWNEMIRLMQQGYSQPVLILEPGRPGVASVCPASYYAQQTCECDASRKAFPHGFFPVSVIDGPPKAVDEE